MMKAFKNLIQYIIIGSFSLQTKAQDIKMSGDPIRSFFIEQEKSERVKANGTSKDFTAQINLKKNPIGEIKGGFPLECQPRAVEDALSKHNREGKEFALLTQNLFSRCEKYWNRPEKPGLLAIIDFMNTIYNIHANPSISSESITLRDGTKLTAFVGVKDKETKRPWVIVKCGVFCTVNDGSSTASFLINLFDQAPFNVIFLSNRTGTNYIQKNESLTMAGHLEVHDLYEVGRWLKEESPYINTIDSIHAMGISLGGSSALMVDPMAEAYGYTDEKKLFNSVLAICPVVNMKETMGDMFANTLKGAIFSKYTWSQLQESGHALKEAQEYLNVSHQPPNYKFPGMMADIVSRYSSKWAQVSKQFRNSKEIFTPEDFWIFNQMKFYNKKINTPYFVWASRDDLIVDNNLNTKSLYNSYVYKNSPQMGIVNVDQGNHCGFSTSYGYPVVSAIMKSFILNNSNEFAISKKLNRTKVNLGKNNLGYSQEYVRHWWKASANQDTVTLYYEVFRPWAGIQCRLAEYFDAPIECRNTISKKIKLSELSFLGLEIPKNESQALILSRKLNGNLRVTANGLPIEGGSNDPNQIEWYSYN